MMDKENALYLAPNLRDAEAIDVMLHDSLTKSRRIVYASIGMDALCAPFPEIYECLANCGKEIACALITVEEYERLLAIEDKYNDPHHQKE